MLPHTHHLVSSDVAIATLLVTVVDHPSPLATSSPKGRESQEQQVTIARLEESCARCEERAEMAEKTAEKKVQHTDSPCSSFVSTV